MSRKAKVLLNIDRELLVRAQEKGFDLDEVFDHALRRLGCEDPRIADERARKWREENREAVEASNRSIEKHGLWWEALARPAKK